MNERAWQVAVETLANALDAKKAYIDYCENKMKELREQIEALTEENKALKTKLDDLTF